METRSGNAIASRPQGDAELGNASDLEVARAARDRRIIEVVTGELPQLVIEAADALIAAKAGIYQRGGQLVRVATLDSDTVQHGVKRVAGSTLILPVTQQYLPLALGRAADWCRYDKREKQLHRIDAPAAVASALLASAGEWKFPSLAGIVKAPTLRNDASLLDRPGYDAQSHLYAAFNPSDFPPINPKPSRDDGLEALDLIDDLFSECIFAGGNRSAHASVAIASIITACTRHAVDVAPAFGYSAFKPGSGKTTTAKAAGLLATGIDPPVIALSDDEAEFKKAILAILIAGDTVVLIDNVARPVDSAALCAVLTSATYSDRVLGVSAKIIVPTITTWQLTGNGLELVGDLTTRVLLSVLDPEMERPEERPFKRNLAQYVLENRGELLKAALTIPLAYAAAGSPAVKAPRSRCEQWDRIVRNAMVWLGCADPLDTQEDLRASDPVREALLAMLTAWSAEFDEPATVADAVKAASGMGQAERSQLHDALVGAAGERNGEINSRKLGRYLKKAARRIEDGQRFEFAGTDTLSCRPMYRVTTLPSVTTVSSVLANPTKENGSDNKCLCDGENPENNGNAVSRCQRGDSSAV
jgi:putative DNA primase/helicase